MNVPIRTNSKVESYWQTCKGECRITSWFLNVFFSIVSPPYSCCLTMPASSAITEMKIGSAILNRATRSVPISCPRGRASRECAQLTKPLGSKANQSEWTKRMSSECVYRQEGWVVAPGWSVESVSSSHARMSYRLSGALACSNH